MSVSPRLLYELNYTQLKWNFYAIDRDAVSDCVDISLTVNRSQFAAVFGEFDPLLQMSDPLNNGSVECELTVS
jgi:hypothetical protein